MMQFSLIEFISNKGVKIYIIENTLQSSTYSNYTKIQIKKLEEEMKNLLLDKLELTLPNRTLRESCFYDVKQEKFYSVSHKFPLVAVAIHEARLGLDVEKISEKTLRVLPKITGPKEKETGIINGATKNEASFIWACKEALYKISKSNPYSFRESFELFDMKIPIAIGKILPENTSYLLEGFSYSDHWIVVASE